MKGGTAVREKGKDDAMCQCPYYKEDKDKMVNCEGPYVKSKLHLGFSNSRSLQEHKKHFCHGKWYHCALAEMNNRKYNYDPR